MVVMLVGLALGWDAVDEGGGGGGVVVDPGQIVVVTIFLEVVKTIWDVFSLSGQSVLVSGHF
jgi:hypothetical protein